MEQIKNKCMEFQKKAIETVLEFAGSSELKKQMDKMKINYVKLEKNRKVIYILRHKEFVNGRISVTL